MTRVARFAQARALLAVAAASGVGACAPQVTSVGEWSPGPPQFYWEAEEGELASGFTVELDERASSGRFILPPEALAEEMPGDARAIYTFTIATAERFTFWGRIHSPDTDSNRFWIQVDEGPFYKWRISVGDIWYWDDFHDDTSYGTALVFELAPGNHRLTVANCAAGAGLDRLYATAAADVPPGNVTSCNPPHSIEREGVCLPSCGSQSGTTCGVTACSGKEILDAYDCDVCCRSGP